jgi:hypothetical protein
MVKYNHELRRLRRAVEGGVVVAPRNADTDKDPQEERVVGGMFPVKTVPDLCILERRLQGRKLRDQVVSFRMQ